MLQHLSHPRGRDFEFRMREVPDLEIARITNAKVGDPVEAVCRGRWWAPALSLGRWLEGVDGGMSLIERSACVVAA